MATSQGILKINTFSSGVTQSGISINPNLFVAKTDFEEKMNEIDGRLSQLSTDADMSESEISQIYSQIIN